MRTFAFLAAAAVVVSARGATVRTASENWVTNRIAQAVAPLCTMIAAKADDSSVVHTNGDETIAGQKTFTDKMTVPFISAGIGDISIGLSGRISQQTAGGLIDDTILPNYGEVKAELAGYLPLEGGEIVGDLSVADGGLTLYGTEFPVMGGTWVTWYRNYVKLSSLFSERRIYIPTPTGDEDDFALRSDLMDEYIEGTWTAATASWTGHSRASALRDGHHIRLRLPYAGAANVTLNLTLADGSTTGALPCYFQGSTTRLSTQYGAGSIVGMTYRDGVWRADGDYDANTNYYDRHKALYCKAAAAIVSGKLAVGTASGYVEVRTNVTFDLDYPIMFVNAAQTAGKSNGDNWYSSYSGVNLATTVAGWGGDNATRGLTVYLIGTVDDAANTFTIDGSCPFSLVRTPPCIPLGHYNANANSSFTFLPGPLIEEEAAGTIAMFVLPVNHETGGSFAGFELKASTNNFSHLATEDVRLQFYAQSEVADTGRESPYIVDRMRMYTGTCHGTEDVRAYTIITNTLEWTHKLMSVVVLVDAGCLARHPGGGWLSERNEELIWCYARNTNFSYEKEPGTDAPLWRPIAPVRWFRKLPDWAR